MYEVIIYHDKNGKSQVYDFLKEITAGKGKDARINSNKVNDYIQALATYGTYIGEPVCKHLDGEIWELRKHQKERLIERNVNLKIIWKGVKNEGQF